MATYKTAGLGTYTLAGSISSTATSITLSSFKVPITETNVTMSSLGTTTAYGTLSPGTNDAEFISFTGITQNANGTATLTGVTRGLNKETPYTTSSSFKRPHTGQALFILSNSPNVYDQYTAKVNDETITGTWTFPNDSTTPKLGSSYVAPTTQTQIASKGYVDSVAIAGAPDASTTVKGITKLSSAPASATNPIAVGDNDTRMPTQSENDALVGTSGTPSSSNKYVTNDDTSSSAVADKVVRANGTSLPGLDGSALLNIPEIYGPGSDGAVTINSGSFTSGPITNNTLTRDAYFTDLTIDSTRVLDTANFKIFCTGTLTNNGTIRCNGGNASGTTAGTAVASGTLFGGSNGGAGVSSSGGGSATGGGGGGGGGTIVVYAKNIVNNSSITANGGNGANAAGSGGSVGNSNGNVGTNLTLASRGGAGGASGTATIGISASSGGTVATSTVTDNAFKLFTNYASFFDFVNISPIKAGGGGGGGGFNVGANSAATGGGGGGGGVVLLVYQNGTFSTETATEGTGGTSTATSGSTTSGSSGSSGSVIKIQLT